MNDMPIGTVFEHEGVELVVIPTAHATCAGCYLRVSGGESCCQLQISWKDRRCLSQDRKDKTPVIYMRPNDYAVARLKGELS